MRGQLQSHETIPDVASLIRATNYAPGYRPRAKCPGAHPGYNSPDRRGVLQAALGPQRVEAALDLERRAFADVALEHLAVVADVAHDAHHPVLGEPELFAVVALGADQLLDVGIFRLERCVDVLRRDARLFGVEHGEVHPFDDVEPLIVAVAHRRA